MSEPLFSHLRAVYIRRLMQDMRLNQLPPRASRPIGAAEPRPPRSSARLRHWAWLSAGFVVGLATAFGLGVALDHLDSPIADKPNTCGDVGTQFDDVWTEEVRAELDQLVGEAAVTDNIQHWVDRWVAARTDECEAGQRTASPCLARLSSKFHAAMRVHVRGRPPAIFVMLPELGAPESCLDNPDLFDL